MTRYIDLYRDQFGGWGHLPRLRATERGFITSRGYRAAKTRPVSHRQVRDAALIPILKDIHQANYGVYGAGEDVACMTRAGWLIRRDQCARLMRKAGVSGAVRGRKPRTTIGTKHFDDRRDLVDRDFQATAPNRLWAADITYVRTTAGF